MASILKFFSSTQLFHSSFKNSSIIFHSSLYHAFYHITSNLFQLKRQLTRTQPCHCLVSRTRAEVTMGQLIAQVSGAFECFCSLLGLCHCSEMNISTLVYGAREKDKRQQNQRTDKWASPVQINNILLTQRIAADTRNTCLLLHATDF